jgi:hypothetical protein
MEWLAVRAAARWVAAVGIVGGAVLGCSESPPLGPAVPTGATELEGSPMTSGPPPPPGWHLNEVTPSSEQEAHSSLLTYVKRTIAALPPGTTFDSGAFVGSGATPWCDDQPDDPATAPVRLQALGDIKVPDGMAPEEIISAAGQTWRSWGWYVYQRDDFKSPNQFGYGPDGYRLQIEVSNPPSYPPTLTAISPCFPGNLVRDELQFPRVVTAE